MAAKKKDNKLFVWIIISIVAFFLLNNMNNGTSNDSNSFSSQQDSRVGNVPPQGPPSPDDSFMTVRFFDAEGRPVNVKNYNSFYSPMSLVNNVPGIGFIAIDIKVSNNGTAPVICVLKNLQPTTFNNAVTKDVRPILPGQLTEWTSNLMNTTQIGENGVMKFNATAACNYTVGSNVYTLADKIGQAIVNITADNNNIGSIIINTSFGGTPSLYCGDGACSWDELEENETTCPTDCVTAAKANFRTSDLSYLGGGIAYNASCNIPLHDMKWNATISSSASSCTLGMGALSGSYVLVASNLPGGVYRAGYTISASQLWKSTTLTPEMYAVCTNYTMTGIKYSKYDATHTSGITNITNQISWAPQSELICG